MLLKFQTTTSLKLNNKNKHKRPFDMASSKHMKSDSSSEEESDHHQEQVNKDDSTGSTSTKRSYECTYCKRGFTNAQALGGHMNIHRKDRAKAKQQQHQHHHHHHQHANSSVSAKAHNHEDYTFPMSHPLIPIWDDQCAKCYGGYPDAQRNNCMYPPPIFHSPRSSEAVCDGFDFSVPRSESSTFYDDEGAGAGANLSLQIGSTYEHREVMRGDDQEKDGGVDLELRLGPDP